MLKNRSVFFFADDIWALAQPFLPDAQRCKTLLQGYQKNSPLSKLEWKALPLLMRSRWLQVRLRNSRKLTDSDKVDFVLKDFFEVIEWLDSKSVSFFQSLQAESDVAKQ